MLTLKDMHTAREHVRQVAHYTPLDYSSTLSDMTGNELYLKLENLQKTGSFKIRGAYHKIMSLSEEERAKGVIAASAGNHAQGVAFGAAQAGIPSTIVMPAGAPLAKVQATKKYGADVVLKGDAFDDALEHALTLQQQTGATFIHAFNDLHIMAGQGTVALEIMEQLPDVDAIVCPIGGGGLISGVAAAIKQMKPSTKIYGVQSAACPSMVSSLQDKGPVKIASAGTIADGIAVKRPGELTLEHVQHYVDDVFVIDDIEISRTMLYLLERNKLLTEGSGAVSLAALITRKIPVKNKKVVALISGGNVDIHFVSRIIERGLVEAGRFLTLSTIVPDKPGNLNRLLRIVADEHANVISVQHHRISSTLMPGQTEIELSLETKNQQHIEHILDAFKREGYHITRKA